MQSFRTELENQIVERDIIELEKKIRLFKEGKIHEEKFRSLRLARGVYGQRQPGVQMIRIKLPYGKVTFQQLLRICDVSEKYSTGNLHLTTRSDIQIHYVSLDRTPELWAELEQDDITLREACGNTVRNVTASSTAGIDNKEPFDVTPYADALFRYFLRNPICQEMGRKIKIAFSSSDEDTGLAFMHDFGFIPKIKIENGEEIRGFRVLVGGGLGAQPILAKVAYEFLHEDEILPYVEAALRVFDRHGERNSRSKARMKYLIQKIGWDEFVRLVEEEKPAIKNKIVKIDRTVVDKLVLPTKSADPEILKSVDTNSKAYQDWLKTNVFEQKQKGNFGVWVRIQTGDIKIDKVRILVEQLRGYIADDIRITINQGLLFKYVQAENLPYIYSVLDFLKIGTPGFNSLHDITTCPGTDTCNLGITSSYGITRELERMMNEEYPELIYNSDIKIKISGCMNSCGQHGMANIGFHGMSMKAAGKVLPAVQVLLGGGSVGNGEGRVADKVIKLPAKRGGKALSLILDDYQNNAAEGEYFNSYYDSKGEKHFYELLKPLADLTSIVDSDFLDWDHVDNYVTAIGVGECAGVVIDLVQTLIYEAEEKVQWSEESFSLGNFSDSIYHAYAAYVNTAKALLLDKSYNGSTQNAIINEFDKQYGENFKFSQVDFKETVLQINKQAASEAFAKNYLAEAKDFVEKANTFRQQNTLVGA